VTAGSAIRQVLVVSCVVGAVSAALTFQHVPSGTCALLPNISIVVFYVLRLHQGSSIGVDCYSAFFGFDVCQLLTPRGLQ